MLSSGTEWGQGKVSGELTIHVIEGRYLNQAFREFGDDKNDKMVLRITRKDDKSCVTGERDVSSLRAVTPFDARLTFSSPPLFDVKRGRMEFEIINKRTNMAVARAHVSLTHLIHVSPGQAYTVDLLLVPRDAKPPKRSSSCPPGLKIVLYPDFPSSSPERSESASQRLSSISPKKRRPPRAIRCTVIQARGLPDKFISKVELAYRGQHTGTKLCSGNNPKWNEKFTFDTLAKSAIYEDNTLKGSYIHCRVVGMLCVLLYRCVCCTTNPTQPNRN